MKPERIQPPETAAARTDLDEPADERPATAPDSRADESAAAEPIHEETCS